MWKMSLHWFVLLSALSLTLFACGAIGGTPDDPPSKVLQVKVYYEALCPDSEEFICGQLNDAMIGNNWLQYTDLQFVPYGKASTWTNPETNVTNIYCQHGNTECELNALHACIVENNSVEEQLKLINCLMTDSSTNIDQCGEKNHIDVRAAKNCKDTRTNEDILQKFGEETSTIDLSYVPTFGIDEICYPWKTRSRIYLFDKVFCRMYKNKYNITLEKC